MDIAVAVRTRLMGDTFVLHVGSISVRRHNLFVACITFHRDVFARKCEGCFLVIKIGCRPKGFDVMAPRTVSFKLALMGVLMASIAGRMIHGLVADGLLIALMALGTGQVAMGAFQHECGPLVIKQRGRFPVNLFMAGGTIVAQLALMRVCMTRTASRSKTQEGFRGIERALGRGRYGSLVFCVRL